MMRKLPRYLWVQDELPTLRAGMARGNILQAITVHFADLKGWRKAIINPIVNRVWYRLGLFTAGIHLLMHIY